MDGEQNGTQAQQVEQQENQATQQQANQQETQGKHAKEAGADTGAGSGADAAAYEAQLAERDSRIAELESLDSYMLKYRKVSLVSLMEAKLDGVYVSCDTE